VIDQLNAVICFLPLQFAKRWTMHLKTWRICIAACGMERNDSTPESVTDTYELHERFFSACDAMWTACQSGDSECF
jgi:hypothetical protein